MKLLEAILAASLLWLHCSGRRIQSSAPGCVLNKLPFTFRCQLYDIEILHVDEVGMFFDIGGYPFEIASCNMSDKYYNTTALGKYYLRASRTQCLGQNPIQQNPVELEFAFTLIDDAAMDLLENLYCGAKLIFPGMDYIYPPLDQRNRTLPICDVFVSLILLNNETRFGAPQRITCIVNGNYSGVGEVNPIILNVSCPHGRCEYISERSTNTESLIFNATWLWDETEVHCRLGKDPSSPYFDRLKLKVTGISLSLSQRNPISTIKSVQILDCRAKGNYSAILSTHPMKWNVTCPAKQCTYTVQEQPNGASLTFNVSSAWSNAQVMCYIDDFPTLINSNHLLIIVQAGEPPVITPFGDVTFFEDQIFVISCHAADESLTDVLSWHVQCASPSVSGSCAMSSYESQIGENGFGVPALILNLKATHAAWNGTTITCTDRSTESSDSILVTTQPLPKISVSTEAIITYVGLTAAAACSARQLWTPEWLSWSVQKCGDGAGPDKCTIATDVQLANGVRQLKFVASRYWNGATLVCSATKPYRQQSQPVNVKVKPFPGLYLTPAGANQTFVELENATLLCRASEHFPATSLLWTTTCKAGRCPASRQGEASGLAVDARYLRFTATDSWNGSTASCSVFQHPESIVSQIIFISGSPVKRKELEVTSSDLRIFIGMTSVLGILVLLLICILLLLNKKVKDVKPSTKKLTMTVTEVGQSKLQQSGHAAVGGTADSSVKKTSTTQQRYFSLASVTPTKTIADPTRPSLNSDRTTLRLPSTRFRQQGRRR